MSTLPVSQLACQVSHDPLLLCCCFVLRESRTAGMRCCLMGFSCHVLMSGGKKQKEKKTKRRAQACTQPTLPLYVGKAGQSLWPKRFGEFMCKSEEVQQCQRGLMGSEHTEHIPEGQRGCDFCRLSQGLGYSLCLCELMLLLSQYLSSPIEMWYTICFHCEELLGSIIFLKACLDYTVSSCFTSVF